MMPSETPLAWWEITFLALVPFAAVFAFQILLVDQASTIDPWLYTGLARNLWASWVQYGPSYYAVRFSAVLPVAAAYELFGDVYGYLVLHYLAYLLLAGSVYAIVRQFCDRGVAAIIILFLVCNPLAANFLIWDYVSFLAIPYFVASLAFWRTGARRSPLWPGLAGFFAAAAIVAHLYIVIGLAIFYLVETSIAVRRGRPAFDRLLLDASCATIGFALCWVAGWLGYVTILGWFSPIDLVRPTVAVTAEIPGRASTWSVPYLDWAAHLYVVYVPIIVAVAALAATRLRPRGAAVIFWFSLIYIAIIFSYRIVAPTFVLEQYFYFVYLVPAILFLLAITLSNLPERENSLAAFALGVLLVAFAHVWLSQVMDVLYARMSGDFGALAALALAAVAIGFLILVSDRHRAAAPMAAGVLAVMLQVTTFATPHFGNLYSSLYRSLVWSSYMTGTAIADITKQHWRSSERVLTWTPNNHSDLAWAASFVNFWGSLNDHWTGKGMPELGTPELKKLSDKRITQILLASDQSSIIDEGELALKRAGFKIEERDHETLGNAPTQSYARLLEIIERPPQ